MLLSKSLIFKIYMGKEGIDFDKLFFDCFINVLVYLNFYLFNI